MKEKIYENYFFFLISIIPISIILGSTISLLNIFLLGFSSLIVINYKQSNFYKDISFKLLIIIYLYLIFNSLISYLICSIKRLLSDDLISELKSLSYIKYDWVGFFIKLKNDLHI